MSSLNRDFSNYRSFNVVIDGRTHRRSTAQPDRDRDLPGDAIVRHEELVSRAATQ